jgi:DNA-binding NarL/FixJ family response regulator
MSHQSPKPGAKIRVAVVEDDKRIAGPLLALLQRAPDFDCLGVFHSCEEALERIPEAKPDVVIIYINLPGMDGIGCVRKLKQSLPHLNILMFTVYEDSEKIFDSLVAGASGYLLKRSPREELIEAIRDVHAGGSPMTSNIARKVVQHFQKPARPSKSSSEVNSLTEREQEVLELLAKGAMYKEIADQLGISLDAVRKRIRGIYQKLQVRSRTEAVLKFLKK